MTQFRREVAAGHWPAPLPIDSRPRRWSKESLDRRLAEFAGLAPASSMVDPVMGELESWSL
jgi:hypothetical protein